MSDEPKGPGWWIASDGNWYPPEQHPSARDGSGEKPAQETGNGQRRRWQGNGEHVGPQFPDLFQKAMQGSHLADNVSVKYDGDDQRAQTQPSNSSRRSAAPATGGGGTQGVAGATIGAPAKRKWRKGH